MTQTQNIISLAKQIKTLVSKARTIAASQINTLAIFTNITIGKMIIESEQKGKHRAEYAKKTLILLSKRLTKELGKGFSERNLQLFRKFYQNYKSRIPQTVSAELPLNTKSGKEIKIWQTLSAKSQKAFSLSWSHYVFLMGIDNLDERMFYEIEASKENWSLSELRRQFNTSLYERIALSRNKKKVKELSKKGLIITMPHDTIKEPCVLEFLGLEEKHHYTENELESAIIDRLGNFMLEMGKGFLFQARQKRITLEDRNYYVDLVLYNRYLKSFVLIDLKIGELTHTDLGQMQMYVNYYDRFVKSDTENKTIGIILCKKNNQALVEITLPKSNKQIFSKKYKLYLPSKQQLKQQLKKYIEEAEEKEY